MLFSCRARTTSRRALALMSAAALTLLPAVPAYATTPRAVPSVDATTWAATERLVEAAPGVVVPAEATWTFRAPVFTVVALPAPQPAAPVQRATPEPPTNDVGPSAAQVVPVPAPPAATTASGSTVLDVATQYLGVPYVAGGTTPAGFDCSGFTSYVYAQLGITLPRSSADQKGTGTVVTRDQAQPGDLIWSPGHVGIYAGDNTQIDAPRPGKSVALRPIWQADPLFIRITA